MDEMEAYRQGIERRHAARRLKTDRRVADQKSGSRFLDSPTVIDLIFIVAFWIALLFCR